MQFNLSFAYDCFVRNTKLCHVDTRFLSEALILYVPNSSANLCHMICTQRNYHTGKTDEARHLGVAVKYS
jgi:hypothetical protein